MNIKKFLFIAYTFPPIPYGGTYRALRLCRGFADKNIECHVVTIKEYSDIPNDYKLLAKVPDSVNVYRTPIIDPWRRYQSYKKRYAGKRWFRNVNKVVSFFLRLITFPDHMLLWVPFAAIKARQVIKQQQIDTVLVSSPPDSSQIVGWILKKTCKVHWIADFRDPIYGNVAQVDMIDPIGFLGRLEKKLRFGYDRFISLQADTLVANTETHARQLKENYGCNNVHVIRNSFDPFDFINVEETKVTEFTIAHIGSIYGKRNPDLLFAAICQLAEEYAPEKLKLKVIFLGLGGGSLRESVEKFKLDNYVTVLKQAPHEDAITCMCNSHLLLLLKATGKWSQGQIPGKFFEYVGSRKPILCIGPKKSEVAQLIQANNLGYVIENNSNAMFSLLKSMYQDFIREGSIKKFKNDQASPFSSINMVEKMSTLFTYRRSK